MTDTAKPTPGPWNVFERRPAGYLCGYSVGGDGDVPVAACNFGDTANKANADLICEAGTVYHETSLTPRQLLEEKQRMHRVYRDQEREIEQLLGKALGYPWYKDDQKNFPGATEEDGVCIGEHVTVTIVMEAAEKLTQLQERVKELEAALAGAEKELSVWHESAEQADLAWYDAQERGELPFFGLKKIRAVLAKHGG